jgi:excisionase family DNA binding protein
MFENYNDILTVEEVSEMLLLGKSSVYELLDAGKLKGYRKKRVWKIPKTAVIEYVEEELKRKFKR